METPAGTGRVVEVKVLRERVTVKLEDGTLVRLAGPGLEPVEDDEERDRPTGRRGRRRR